jgi:hypothetical protein
MKTNFFKHKLALTLVLICIYFISCNRNSEKFISEGVITFDAEVINKDHSLAGLAPTEMTTYFKNNHFHSEMSTMGIFVSKFITNPDNKTFISMVKVFDVKNALIENEKEIKDELNEYQLEFKETDETKIIAGYNCKKLIAVKKNQPNEKFEVYYTNELNIEKPNFSTPYELIDGVVMKFRLKKFDLEMEFTANNVKKEIINQSYFELPKDYKIVSKDEMKEFFKSVQ